MSFWILVTLAAYMLIILIIGFRSGRGAYRDTESFFVADRNINSLQESMAVFTTIAPANALLGTVGLFYVNGSNMLGYWIGYVFVTPLVYWLIGTKLRRLGRTRGYQTQAPLMRDLFNSNFLYYALAVSGILFMVPYFMTNAVALGVLLRETAGVPFGLGAAIFVVVSASYCMHGGLRAVADTDIFHGVLLLVFFVVTGVALVLAVGGVHQLLADPKAIVGSGSADLKPFYAWILYVGLSPAVWPDRSLRMYAVRDERNLRRGVIMTGVMLGIGTISYLIFGLAARSLVPGITDTDTTLPKALSTAAAWLLPFFIVNAWGSGMSNFSAGMLSTANIFIKDLYEPWVARQPAGSAKDESAKHRRSIFYARLVMVVLSGIAMLVCLGNPPFIWTLISITINFFIQLAPMFLLGLYWNRSSRVGVVVSWTTGVALTFIFTFVVPAPFGIFPGLTALAVNLLVYVLVSIAVPDSEEELRTRRGILAQARGLGADVTP